ncbi:MAG: type III pantothenate kinase [Campylobacterales bacterium]|nr:type III pantothenate kinase [Campylobacterales bacterium]
MLLCDIGNTSYHFLGEEGDYKKSVKDFNPQTLTQKVYYISVNSYINETLEKLPNWINLLEFVDLTKYYSTMGVDRIFAVEALEHGVIVDAGSAITVDRVESGNFQGGFIYPGLRAMQETYAKISPALAYSFNFDVELDIMPKNSQDAVSYGTLKTLYSEVSSYGLPIVLTGGDAELLSKVFKNAKVDKFLIFSGMKKIMKKANIC